MKYLLLSGGLGNQMFEYAFYIACKNKGMKIQLNRDLYEYNRMHNGYLLDRVFGVPDSEIKHSSRLSVIVTRFIRRYHPLSLVYSDIPMTYCEDAFNTRRKYFDGCFIMPQYFADVQDKIRNTFVFKSIDHDNIVIANGLQIENSVSIHIRRGDYLKNSIYCVCDENYYRSAIECICSQVPNVVFYVFSDDPNWCDVFMKKFNVQYKIIRHNKGIDSYKDMYLMTMCKHNIIANSTFSWWGAWLNNHDDKIIIAPDKWTTTIPMSVMPNWSRLKV